MSGTILGLFNKSIWSNSADERSAAVLKLANYLPEAPEADQAYALERILKGLGSNIDSSRSGFSLALTELLRTAPSCDPLNVLDALVRATDKSHQRDADEKDLLFARLFGLHALVRSGVCFNIQPSAIAPLLHHLLALMQTKSWLKHPASFVILELVDRFAQGGSKATEQDWAALKDTLFVQHKQWHSQKLTWLLKLQFSASDRFGDAKSLLKGHFQNSAVLLHPSNLPAIAKMLKGEAVDDESDKSTPMQSQQLPVELQLILHTYAAGQAGSGAASLPDFYKSIMDDTLLSNSASVLSKSIALRFFTSILETDAVSTDTITKCLQLPSTLRTIINHASDKKASLHNLSRSVLTAIQDLAKRRPQAALPLLATLTTAPSSMYFDAITKTKTVEALVLCLEGEAVTQYIGTLKSHLSTEGEAAQQEITEESDENAEQNKQYRWAIDQLLLVSRKKLVNAPSSSQSPSAPVYDIMDFLASIKMPTVTLQQHAQSRASTILGDLLSGNIPCETQSQILSQAIEIKKKHALKSKALRNTRKAVKDAATSTKSFSGQAQAKALESLCNLVLYLTYEEGEAIASLAEEVADVAGAFSGSNAMVEDKPDEGVVAEPSAVLVDYLLTLMRVTGSRPALQPVVRSVVEQSFEIFTSVIGDQAIQMLRDQLLPGSDEDEEAGDKSESGEESSEHEDSSDDEDDVEENGDQDGASDAGSDLGINLDVDPELRAKVEAALMGAGLGAAQEGDDEVDANDVDEEEVALNDDQMMALDDQLAAAFREHVSNRNANRDMERQDMQTSQRALDLIEMYCKKQPTGPYISELIAILYDVATSRTPSEEGARAHADLAAKAGRIVRAVCSNKTKTLPTVANPTKTFSDLKRIHSIARSSATEQALSNTCSLHLSRLLIASEPDLSTDITGLYRDSLRDFAFRKGSALHTDFILSYLQRGYGWDLLPDVLEAVQSPKTVTAYRRIQAVGLLQALLNANKSDASKMTKALPLMTTALFSLLLDGESNVSLNAARTKEVLKTVLAIARIAQTVSVSELEALQNKASTYEQQLDNGNPGLRSLVQQIASVGKARGEKRKKDGEAPSREANGTPTTNGDASSPQKKKKKQKV